MNHLRIPAAGIACILTMCAPTKHRPEKRSLPEFEAAFLRKDKNHDGHLTREEFTADAKHPEKSARKFDRLDRNGDGRVSDREFTTRIVRAR